MRSSMKKAACLIIIILAISILGFSQRKVDFRFWEDSLNTLRQELLKEPDETLRLAMNEDFMTLLENVLQLPNSFKYSWDSVRNFSVLASSDKVFKLFTWFVNKDDYSVENFGFIQVYSHARKKYILYPLYDKQNVIDYPNTYVGNHNRWYGAVYYKLIQMENKNITYYTLLGWNGHDLFTNQKIIEVLHFNKNMMPIFGAHVFKNYPKRVSRIIFEYSKNASLHLDYEIQEYEVGTGKYNPKTRQPEFKRVDAPMIIFNRLIPLTAGMDSIAAFLVPESSLNQGFIARNGKWYFLKDVHGTNPDKIKGDYHYKPRQYYTPNTH